MLRKTSFNLFENQEASNNDAQTSSSVTDSKYSLNTISIHDYDNTLMALYFVPLEKEQHGFGLFDELISANELRDKVMPLLVKLFNNSDYNVGEIGSVNGKHRYIGIKKAAASNMDAKDLIAIIEMISMQTTNFTIPAAMLNFKDALVSQKQKTSYLPPN